MQVRGAEYDLIPEHKLKEMSGGRSFDEAHVVATTIKRPGQPDSAPLRGCLSLGRRCLYVCDCDIIGGLVSVSLVLPYHHKT